MNESNILRQLGITEWIDNRSEKLCDCIFCHDRKKNLQINFQKGVYHCWVCNKGGSIVNLISEYRDISLHEAQVIYDSKDIDVDKEVDYVLEQLKEIESKKHKYRYDIYIRDERFKLWAKRGINKKSVMRLNLGWDKFNNRLVIPIIQNKQCIALIKRGIALDARPKYKNTKGFQRDFCLYPFDKLNLKKKYVMICEGPIDAINLRQLGFNAVAILGSYLSKFQRLFIINNFETVVLATDNDKAGRDAAYNMRIRLNDYCNIHKLVYSANDPAEIKNIKQIEYIKKL